MKSTQGDGARADEAFWLEKHHGRAEDREDYREHRPRRSQPEREAAGHGRGRARTDHRPEGHDHPGQEVHREFQNSQGHAHRLRGHLRGEKMYEFLDRLCNVVLPRVRDFRGLPSNASMAAATTPWA